MRSLRRLLVLVLAVLALTLGTGGAANAAGDDYPWRRDISGSADWYGFSKRQCVSFAAWRIDQRGTRISARQGWGNAHYWDDTAYHRHIPRSTRPVVGSIAHWNAYESSPYYSPGSTYANGRMRAGALGHVAYVERVYPDGSALVSQYNTNGVRSFSLRRVRAPRYLYIPR